jgi:hypothetical protein
MSSKIRVECPNCGKSLNVDATLAGRQGRCPGCKATITIQQSATQKVAPEKLGSSHTAAPNPPPREETTSANRPGKRATEVISAQLATQPSHSEELSQDQRRIAAAISTAPDKFAIVEPYLMNYEQPLAMAVQRQFPFSIFSDIVLLSTHRLMVFKRFFTKINMFDVNYIDFQDVKVMQGFFTSTLTITTAHGRASAVNRLVTDQALNVYRMCQDIETKARIARRQFQLEENRSRTTSMQINNLVAPPDSFAQSQKQNLLLPGRDISRVGDEESNPYRLTD